MSQLLLFPDPRPLVERLGPAFFLEAPVTPGVYIMRDQADNPIYVGKAKNLRKRLCCYRVANPDRLPKRHLRMLRAVRAIELTHCEDESQALRLESELLLALRPKFNRAGTWPMPKECFGWRLDTHETLLFTTAAEFETGWSVHGPITGARHLCAALVRLCWLVLNPNSSFQQLPNGWVHGRLPRLATLQVKKGPESASNLLNALERVCEGSPEDLHGLVEATLIGKPSCLREPVDEDLDALQRIAARLSPTFANASPITKPGVEFATPKLVS